MSSSRTTKNRILTYLKENGQASKPELAQELHLSMPTILSNLKQLEQKELILEEGEYQSNGGRKAKVFTLNKSHCMAVGIDITANHMVLVLVNFGGEIIKKERIRVVFSSEMSYVLDMAKKLSVFVEDYEILGVGISLPGIIDQERMELMVSHALKQKNYSLKMMQDAIPFDVYFENDANAAMMAEPKDNDKNLIYLSLSNTLGGAISMKGMLFRGDNQKSGEFGHMVLNPKGKKCYCGKRGCADAYCSAAALLKNQNEKDVEAFIQKVKEGDEAAAKTWDEYLWNLALLISNLRMAYDTDIILGGDVGGVLEDYMFTLGEKLQKYNLFEIDISYLKNCTYHREASAVGVTSIFFEKFIEKQ